MELFTLSLDTLKNVGEVAIKETAEVSKDAAEIGKTGLESGIEHLDLGGMTAGDVNPVSFGSLASGAYKLDENYLQWKDGVQFGELKQEWIEKLANEISDIYGEDNLKATPQYVELEKGELPHRFYSAAMKFTTGELSYDPKYWRNIGNAFGEDAILGSISHEVGHRVVENVGLTNEIQWCENEACADYIAGLTTRLCKMNPSHRLAFYNNCPEASTDGVHPGKSVRMETFLRGYNRIDRGAEASTLRAYEEFSIYDLEKTYHDKDLLREILIEDVIEPLRSGEIEWVGSKRI